VIFHRCVVNARETSEYMHRVNNKPALLIVKGLTTAHILEIHISHYA